LSNVVPLIVSQTAVRDYLELNSPGSSSKYSDETIGSNIRAAQTYLEAECHRFFYDHPNVTVGITTMLAAQVAIPGFRSIASCVWGGATLSVAFPGDGNQTPSAWAILEQSPGVSDPVAVALQFRAWRADSDRPWWYADSQWWDKSLDSPFYPGNRGGGYAWTSMPNDLVIVGDGGYASGNEPFTLLHAVKVLAGFYTMRPASILADVAITPAGGVVTYSQMPAEVVEFVADWKIGQQVASM
jgi:hypothetical protein